MVFGLTGCVWQIDDIGIYLPCILHGLISSARIVFNAENDQIRAVNHRTVSDLMRKLRSRKLMLCSAKKVLLPAVSMIDFATVPADLMSAFQLIPYQSAEDAVFKALGVE